MVARNLWTIALGMGAVALVGSPAKAIDQVNLQFIDTQVVVPFSAIETFAKTGEVRSDRLQTLLQRFPQAGDVLRNTLTQQITIQPQLSGRLFSTPLGEFALARLGLLIDSFAEENIPNISTAVRRSLQNDNQISLLELMSYYPKPEVTLDLSGLNRAFLRTKDFIERVEPVLAEGKARLRELLCEGDRTSFSPDSMPSQTAAKTCHSFIDHNTGL